MYEANDHRLSRRELLHRAGIVTVAASAATAVPSILAACGGGESATAVDASTSTTTLFPGGADVDTEIAAKLKGKTVKIGFTPPVLSEFFNEMEMAAFWALKEFEDRFGINWVWERAAPSGNFETVQEHFNIVQNWVQAGFDVIAICSAIDLNARNKLYSQAIEAGAAVYEFNQPNELWPLEDQVIDSSITYDNVLQSGYAAGTYIAEKLDGKGDIIQIWGPSGHWAEARQKGLDMALAANPGLKVVAKADGGYVRDKGLAAAQNLLQRYPKVNAIYGENEEMALGASQAIDVAGLKHWNPDTGEGILTIGADGLMTGFQAIKDGRLTATVYVGTVDQGIGIAKTILSNRLLGMSVDKIQNQPCAVVDKNNVGIYEALTKWALAAPKKY